MDNMILILQYALIPLIVSAPALVVLLAIKIITLPFRRIKRNEENAHHINRPRNVRGEIHGSLPKERVQSKAYKGRSVSW
jgi:hypothetical protein